LAGSSAPAQQLPLANDATAVLNPAALEQLRLGLGERVDSLMPKLIQTFFENAALFRAKVAAARDRGDSESVRRAAHTLKSNSELFGATALAALYRDLEHRASDELLAVSAELLAQIDVELARVQAALPETLSALQAALSSDFNSLS
jgi:HPt (histidine-containing phosphotransfer) domain-containing protein